MKMKLSIVAFLLALCAHGCWCRSAGPPLDTRVCDQLWPAGHGPISGQQQGNGGFLIRTNLTLSQQGDTFNYMAGERYSVVITGTESNFRGFLIQARSVPGNMLIGTFVVEDTGIQQTLNCDLSMGVATDATASHANLGGNDVFNTVSLIWIAPPDMSGQVNISYTIVVTFPTYYIARSAAQNLEQVVTPPPPEAPTNLSAAVTPPSMNSSEYRLIFRSPEGCVMPNCMLLVAIDNNAGDRNYLDFYISAQTQSWAAVGFSQTRSMFTSDVLGCYVNETTDLVEVADTWNVVNMRRNELDSVQDTVLFNATNENGIITCTFVRSIDGTVVGNEDRFLNQSLFVMYGTGLVTGDTPLAFFIHGLANVPTLAVQRFNPTVDSNADVIIETPRDPEDYRLTLRTPAGCNVSECTLFIGIDNNNVTDEFLDIYMEGAAEAWVAVGFTDSRNMFDSDVVACNVNPETGLIEALDTWNPEPNLRRNDVDTSQDVILFSSNITDGRISCTVAKSVRANGNVNASVTRLEDLNLNDSLWMNYALRPSGSAAGRLQAHNPQGRFITAVRANPVLDNQTALEVPPVIIPEGVANITIAPTDYRLRIRDPPSCDPSDCDVYIGITTNQGNSPDMYLDFYIEGASQGWAAVGFSETQNMFAADVVGCNVNPDTGMVEALDTWNPAAGRTNLPDPSGNADVVLFSGTFQDGRIICRFARRVVGSDATEDLDLSNSYYVMYGGLEGGVAGSGSFSSHTQGDGRNPRLSADVVNPVQATGEVQQDNTRRQLTQAHGILMLIAWPLLAVSAIFFAAWMRPALPNGEWFQIHRFFMSGSIVVAAIGFILIFIANRNNPVPGIITLGSDNPTGTVHFVFGYIVMFLHLLNPFIALCRCKPNDKNRWIFNIIHGTAVGMFAEILALTNVGIGLAIFSRNLSQFTNLTILWVYIGYIGIFLALILILFLLFTIIAYTSSGEERGKLAPSLVKPLVDNGSSDMSHKKMNQGVELTPTGTTPGGDSDDPPKPKTPSRDSPVRWLSLAIFLAAAIVFTIVLIILVAL